MSKKKCLFLGYSENETKLIRIIKKKGWLVSQKKTNLRNQKLSHYDCILSYGYKNIIKENIIKKLKKPIINLHISYLPFNKGVHPNVWSFLEKTPSGVSIHEINSKIDSGPIIYRKLVKFNKNKLSFYETYNQLKEEIENLFIENMDKLMNHKYPKPKQRKGGSIHYKKDLEVLKNNNIFYNWKQNINKTIKIYESFNKKIKKN